MILPDPLLQLGFAALLEAARERQLIEALRQAVAKLTISELDTELAEFVPSDAHSKLASEGLRGETFFPVPLILRQKPTLLGYYRLLYGFSQKQFYKSGSDCSIFKAMEISGKLSKAADGRLTELCEAFAVVGGQLVTGLGQGIARPNYSNELCLLTLGAQFRGSNNNTKGTEGIRAVFAVLRTIFETEAEHSDNRSLTIRNAAGKRVVLALAADPDILIKSLMDDGNERIVVAIEVKAGEDHSNIWNRIGEAEKSHLTARGNGAVECWTIINDPNAPQAQLRLKSPSTQRFYQLLDLTNDKSPAHADFVSRVRDMVGL